MGPAIREDDIQKLYNKLDGLQEDDVLVLAGSIPTGMPESMYRDIMSRLKDRKLKIAVDATKDLQKLFNLLVSVIELK